MALRDYIFDVIIAIAEGMGIGEDPDDRQDFVKKMGLEQAKGGVAALRGFIACDCGAVIAFEVSAPKHTLEEMREVEKDPRNNVVIRVPENVTDAQGSLVAAANYGNTQGDCDACGARFISCWEFECIKINKDIQIPKDAAEIPQASSFEQSFMGTNDDPTVH